MKLSELNLSKPKIILYGPAGTGKTAFVLTGGSRVTVLDCDNGLRTGLTLKDDWTKERLKVEVLEAHEDAPLRATAYLKARQIINGFKPKDENEIFVLDSLTTFAEFALRNILSAHNRLEGQPQIQDWGGAFRDIEHSILRLRALPCTVILIAHQMISTIDDRDTIQLAIAGKNLPAKLMSYFDEIWHAKVKPMGQGKNTFTLQTITTPSVIARSRCNLLTNTDMNQGLLKVLSALEGKEQEANGKDHDSH